MPELSPDFYPLFWLSLGILLGLMELFTTQLVSVWFALGSLAAIIPAALNAPVLVQFIIFAVVSLVSMYFTRPFAKKFLMKNRVPTNADRIIGETALVTTQINNELGLGNIFIDGLTWSARSRSNDIIEEGAHVKILEIQGVKVIVDKE